MNWNLLVVEEIQGAQWVFCRRNPLRERWGASVIFRFSTNLCQVVIQINQFLVCVVPQRTLSPQPPHQFPLNTAGFSVK